MFKLFFQAIEYKCVTVASTNILFWWNQFSFDNIQVCIDSFDVIISSPIKDCVGFYNFSKENSRFLLYIYIYRKRLHNKIL